MRPLKPEARPRTDPAPSRMNYRMQRLMLTPLFRRFLRVGLPFVATFAIASVYLSDPARQQQIVQGYNDTREQIQQRPEFMVKLLSIEGASPQVAGEIRDIFPVPLPASSFDLDLDAVRMTVEDLPPVAAAALRIRRGGVLELTVTERQPAALWRTRAGLHIVDTSGAIIAEAERLADYEDLLLLTGQGAEANVPEALALRAAAGPLEKRIRGLVRMGDRRWDVVLDNDQRILLPEAQPVRALERVIVLDQTQDMLGRDIAIVDMRLAERPAVRMRERAVDEWWRARNAGAEVAEQ